MLGQRIKQARLSQGLSQRQLCGEEITRNMLSQIESGKARPSMQTLTYLAQALGKPVSFFLEEAAVPTEQPALTAARRHYCAGEHSQCLEVLERWEPGEETHSDQERYLLQTLCAMALAKQAIREGKMIYARTLLEKAQEFGAQTAYDTPAMERERLLLLYEAQAEPSLLMEQLQPDDRELLLRAQAALDRRECEKCQSILAAVRAQSGQYHYLMAQAAMEQKQYALAAEHFLQAEADYPLPCARALEICFRELEDFKMAYHYACKQRQ